MLSCLEELRHAFNAACATLIAPYLWIDLKIQTLNMQFSGYRFHIEGFRLACGFVILPDLPGPHNFHFLKCCLDGGSSAKSLHPQHPRVSSNTITGVLDNANVVPRLEMQAGSAKTRDSSHLQTIGV